MKKKSDKSESIKIGDLPSYNSFNAFVNAYTGDGKFSDERARRGVKVELGAETVVTKTVGKGHKELYRGDKRPADAQLTKAKDAGIRVLDLGAK